MSCRKKSMSKSERIGFVGVGLGFRANSSYSRTVWRIGDVGTVHYAKLLNDFVTRGAARLSIWPDER